MKKVGIYSGVFDPIHHGHISFARKAASELGLDKVYFLAEPEPRHKQQASNVRHRLNMLWLALQDHPELELLPLDHQQFTVHETLPWLEERLSDAELHLLLGTDLFKSVHTWPGFERLNHKVKFVVGQRAGESSQVLAAIDHHPVETPLGDIASTNVRQLNPTQLYAFVPDVVAQYIVAQRLYR